jgi:hypothetical protein
MRNIAELTLLLRSEIELPAGIKLATEDFREGWSFARSTDSRRLGKRILARGWQFIRIRDGLVKSGVGETAQEAIACGLKLALRCVNRHFSAAEIAHLEMTQYPWFFLARVKIFPYRIQLDAFHPVPELATFLPIPGRRKLLPINAPWLYPELTGAMPLVKQMLIQRPSTLARPN